MKRGYKETIVGTIPEEWCVRMLSDVSAMKSGEGITASSITQHDPYPCYGGNGLRGYTSSFTHEGDFALIGRQGALCGNVNSASGKFFASEHAVVVTPRSGTDIHFLTYLLRELRLNRLSEASAQPGLSVSKILQLSVPLPSNISEQRAIAQALGDVDALIATLDRLIAKKRDIKQATMQQLLTGKTRLPGFSGKWEIKPLKELGNCFAGGTPATSRRDYWGGSIYWLPSGRVQDCILSKPKDDEATITSMGVAESAAKVIKPPAVLIAITGATCGNVAMLQFAAAANQSVVAIEPKETTCAGYLYYSLLTERNQMLSMQSGSAQGGINLKAVKSLYVQCPPLIEQAAISAVLSDMDAELTALEARRDKTRALKQGMMQELLTGKTRLI